MIFLYFKMKEILYLMIELDKIQLKKCQSKYPKKKGFIKRKKKFFIYILKGLYWKEKKKIEKKKKPDSLFPWTMK